MLKMSFKSSRKPDQIIQDAEVFFGRRGLKPALKRDVSVRFESDRGFVDIEVTHQSEVTVETGNLEPLVKQFAEQVK